MGHAPDWMRNNYGKAKGFADGGEAQEAGEVDLAPYGFRHAERASDPIEVKGKGFMGEFKTREGDALTEMSADNGKYSFPTVVPTLTKEEMDHLRAGNEPTEEIYRKAEAHAEKRIKEGKSPFASKTELRYPKSLWK